jgi:hypothetical protein
MIEVLKQMVDALKLSAISIDNFSVQKKSQEAIQAGRQAIAELESQEPVAWAVYCDGFIALPSFDSELEARQEMQRRNRKFPHNKREVKALYDTPPQRTWVGLIDEEIKTICVENGWDSSWQSMRFAHAIEAKLKERNENSI